MADYIVRAQLKPERKQQLRKKLEEGAFRDIRPFGRGLSNSLERARRDPETDEIVWEERCFCHPPLAMERKAVLDDYFNDIVTEEVAPGEGWRQIKELPALWQPAIEGEGEVRD